MLASLLPGLRDVRTPLTVGYMYLVVLWLWFGDRWPEHRPAGEGLVARLFDLRTHIGPASTIAAASFAAYLLGALLAVSTQRGAIGRALTNTRGIGGVAARQTRAQLDQVLKDTAEQIEMRTSGFSPHEMNDLERDLALASRTNAADLRTRLLVANQDLYGEYDRLAAEAEFRINVCLPLLVIGVTVAFGLSFWALVVIPAVLALGYQGLVRQTEAESVIDRAVLAGTIDHPVQTIRRRWKS
jgi:hypothetical protein